MGAGVGSVMGAGIGSGVGVVVGSGRGIGTGTGSGVGVVWATNALLVEFSFSNGISSSLQKVVSRVNLTHAELHRQSAFLGDFIYSYLIANY